MLSPVLLFARQGSVAQTACMSSCKHLANKLRELLLDDEVCVGEPAVQLIGRYHARDLHKALPCAAGHRMASGGWCQVCGVKSRARENRWSHVEFTKELASASCAFPQVFSVQIVASCSDRVARCNTSFLQLHQKHFST